LVRGDGGYRVRVTARPSKTGKNEAGPDFETAIRELESIVENIEGGEIGLEKSMLEYERGMGLVARCREILTAAEQKVEELSRRTGPVEGKPVREARSGGDDSMPGAPTADLPF